MDFEDTQFQAAPSGDNAFETFAAAAPPVLADNGGNGGSGFDDFFSGSAPVPPAEQPAVLLAAPASGEAPAAAPPAFDDAANVTDPEDPFFQHYTPPAAPAPPAPAPEEVDPRVEWRKQNQEVLKKKDKEEDAAKQVVKEAAAKHLAKFYEVRTTTLTTRKANNRKSEAHQREVEVPASGSPWEKISALANLNSAAHTKDVSRYKALLITCKSKNVAIRAA
ncbi:hypothetical protein GPECTOR_572g613 [Gonium pectorale]|uniref:Clathrin light chain n=1 Tax=Gonium pectorale TaxID=33097 RepID=A0A150FVR7_GONPE|nr:hypothetical protein GPECTOR_572g613 [Gonium pectorale]|eukprot:KXZ41295.1 hypothetical protein GPECTOR_572g613 [Gonium pectorale]